MHPLGSCAQPTDVLHYALLCRTAALITIPYNNQCGGRGSTPTNGFPGCGTAGRECRDGPWSGVQCVSGTTSVRCNEWWWFCNNAAAGLWLLLAAAEHHCITGCDGVHATGELQPSTRAHRASTAPTAIIAFKGYRVQRRLW